MSVFTTVKDLFCFRRWSLLETMFALYLVVSGWVLSPIPVYMWWAILMDIVAYKRYGFNPMRMPKSYRFLFWFIMVHQFLWVFVVSNLSSVYFNFWFSMIITMGSVFFVAPVLDYKKIKSPIAVITIISIFGLFYQLLLLFQGVPVGQLTIPPFASSRDITNADFLALLRPSSFFGEPAMYCEYMLVPLFICLVDKKFIYAFIIVISMLLTTSTTGVVLSFLMLGAFFLTQKVALRWKLLVVIGAVIIGLAMTKSSFFENTMTKVNNTDLSENERTSIGLTVIPQLKAHEIIFGIPYANISDMYNAGRLKIDTFMWYDEKGKAEVFVSSIWNILFMFGVFGLFLYLLFYYKLFHQSRLLFPYFIAVFAKMFSDPTAVGSSFLFEICFMMCFIRWDQKNSYQSRNIEFK